QAEDGIRFGHVTGVQTCALPIYIKYLDVDRVEAVVNWLETQYPSPAFPARREDIGEATRGSTRYYTAYGVVKRGFPMLAVTTDQIGRASCRETVQKQQQCRHAKK